MLRYSPVPNDEEIEAFARISVTFSQPMVALGRHTDLSAKDVPVRITPQPSGRWRWVGTETLVFEPDQALPLATDYVVEVPRGTRSAAGNRLTHAEQWTISTPAPEVDDVHPSGLRVRPDELFYATFNQAIDTASVTIELRTSADRITVPIRPATAAEIAADEDVSSLVARAGDERVVVFRADGPLRLDTEYAVTIAPGVVSREGPKRGEGDRWYFRTVPPLRVTSTYCGWRERQTPCRPGESWTVAFSNAIDAGTITAEGMMIEPGGPAPEISVYSNSVNLTWPSRPRTRYTVALPASITDVYGQTLGDAHSFVADVGPAPPAFQLLSSDEMIVLDPAAPPRLPVSTVNQTGLRVRVYAVEPDDWPEFQQYRAQRRGTLPGRLVVSEDVPVNGPPDEVVETLVDLSPALTNGLGHAVVAIMATTPPAPDESPYVMVQWIQVTRLGLDAFSSSSNLTAWATSLEDGHPLEGVTVSLEPSGVQGSTTADGTVALANTDRRATCIVARLGNDTALLPYRWDSWHYARGLGLRWYVFDTRGLFRPGEEVPIKGWLRMLRSEQGGTLAPWTGDAKSVRYTLLDARETALASGEAPVNAFGAFDFRVQIPETANLGTSAILLSTGDDDGGYYHVFDVQEFRRPEFDVTTTADRPAPTAAEGVTVAATATYLNGGVLAEAPVQWVVWMRQGQFAPPGHDDYTFGAWVMEWSDGREPEHTFVGRADSTGTHRLRIGVDGAPVRPVVVQVEASVQDVTRQTMSATSHVLIHPADVYVGLRSRRLFVNAGAPIDVEAIVTDLDGRLVSGRPVSIRAERRVWRQVAGEWKEVVVESQQCRLTSADQPEACRFTSAEGGVYRLIARVSDERGRASETETSVWVSGSRAPAATDVRHETVTLVPDKRAYGAGETAEILVVAPFAPAEGLLTVRRRGILRTERFHLSETSGTLAVALDEIWTPSVVVQVDLVGATPRADPTESPSPTWPPRPAFASGAVRLNVPPVRRRLTLAVTNDRLRAPGEASSVAVDVRDSDGAPVAGADVVIAVVDEAVLVLSGYTVPDPLDAFYPHPYRGGDDMHLRANVVLARFDSGPPVLPGPTYRPEPPLDESVRIRSGYAGGASPFPEPVGLAETVTVAAEPRPVKLRADFRALAAFAANVATDERGHAEVALTLPDTLTRYRVMALAAEGVRFGTGESSITAQLPLTVRPSPPRFLHAGDRFELPVLLQNQTDRALEVDVAARAENAIVVGPPGRRVRVPAAGRTEIRIPMAALAAGRARIQVAAGAQDLTDAAEVDLPVWTPATKTTLATYGHLDAGAVAYPIQPPARAVPDVGGLAVTTSSTTLQALTDAVLYLASYRFECAEQIASRLLAVAALRDVLDAFQAPGLPPAAELEQAVQRDIERLRAYQKSDGGFGFWPDRDESWPYVTVHVVHALGRAAREGFDVPTTMLDGARSYVESVEDYVPDRYSFQAMWAIKAYALHVLAGLGDPRPDEAHTIIDEAGLEGVSLETLGWLLPVLSSDPESAAMATAVRRHLDAHVFETAATAHFADGYVDGSYLLHSDRRTDAILLEALIDDPARQELVVKLVEGLLSAREGGRWTNTQENVFVLLALERYFRAHENVEPDFAARAWLGNRFVAEHRFTGRSTDRQQVEVPMVVLATSRDARDLVVAKEGPGRLYYRVGLQYADADPLPPAGHGFTIERRYEGIDRAEDVSRDAGGTWYVAAGARVRVTVTVTAPARRYHVALVDPLAAGFEPLNPELGGTGRVPEPDENGWVEWWPRSWYDHHNLRDERSEAFASVFGPGSERFSYVIRATTPGTFVVPPPTVEEMYHPETFGRGATDSVVVR